MRSLALFIFGCWCSVLAHGQFHTPTIDGVIAPGEYGTHLDGLNQQTAAGIIWYQTWDASYFYIGVQGLNPANDAVNIFVDGSPALPVNGDQPASGSLSSEAYDQIITELPFRCNYFCFVKAGYDEWKNDDGLGTWGAGTVNGIIKATTLTTTEFRIPWSSITGAGMPPSFNWNGFISYDNGGVNGTFGQVPTANPSTAGGSIPLTQWSTLYYTIRDTDNGTADQPFKWISVAYREDNSAATTGGYSLPPGTYMDITVNDNSTDNLDNINNNYQYDNAEVCNRILLSHGTFQVYGDLYIGQGSGLFPADNTPADVLAVVELYGNCGLYNRGRLDCVPELDNPGDELNRRILVEVVDTLTIEYNQNLQVGFFRFGDLQIRAGALMRASTTTPGDVNIEFQMGTIDNNGTMQLTDPIGATVNIYTRGFMPVQDNVVYLTSSAGTGIFNLNTLLIGTEVGYLRPVSTAAPVTINLSQNLEIYSNLICQDGTGELNFAFVGTGEQYIRGAVGETSEPVATAIPTLPVEVTFNDITIHNDNGLANNNLNADVFFQSFNTATYGNIDFLIAGELTLISGDLVTRDRVAPTVAGAVHELTLLEGGTIDATGTVSDIGGAPSSFVDGPFRREVASAALSTEVFPIGKSATLLGVEVGDYRRLVLLVDQQSAASNVYVAEMFLGDQSGAYAWPDPLPENVANISNIRHWSVSDTSALMTFDQLQINLSYGDNEYSDAVTNEPALRILKDNGAGQWYNIQPLGVGGSAAPDGEITSQDINGFSISPFGDFILANVNGIFNPLDGNRLILSGDLTEEHAHLSILGGGAPYQTYQVLRSSPRRQNEQEIARIEYPAIEEFFTDASIQNEQYVYRVKGLLPDGRERYSNAIYLHPERKEIVWADDDLFRLFRRSADQAATVVVQDLRGKIVWEFVWPSQVQELDLQVLNALAGGRYLLKYHPLTGPGAVIWIHVK